MAELQAATVESNVIDQFDVHEGPRALGRKMGLLEYQCLLSPCFEGRRFLQSLHCLKTHRKTIHRIYEDTSLPSGFQISVWVALGKPRPYDFPVTRSKSTPSIPRPGVSVHPRPITWPKLDLVPAALELGKHGQEPASVEDQTKDLLFQFEVREDDSGRSQFFCLLPRCKESGFSVRNMKSLRRHRKFKHKELNLEDIPVRHCFFGTKKGWNDLGVYSDAARDAQCLPGSPAAGPAQKKVRRSVDVANREDEELVSYCDYGFTASEDCDRGGEDVVDDQVVDQIPGYRTRQGSYAQTVEEAFGANPVPSHASAQITSLEESTIFQAEPPTPDPIHTARDFDLNVALNEEFDLNVALPEA